MQIHELELPTLREELGDKKVVLAVGAFDLFHAGHMDYLRWARDIAGQNGIVAVMVRTDQRVSAGKGKERPVIEEGEREYIVANTKPVDVTFFGTETPHGIKTSMHAAKLLRPNIVAIGDGWRDDSAQWGSLVPGVEVALAPFPHRQSTSRIIQKVRNF